MPWTKLARVIGHFLRVQGYPTYVLLDEHGKILSRPGIGFAAAVQEALARLSPA